MGESTVRPYRDVLAIQGARALIGASAASEIGNWLYNAALLGYVYSATRSAGWVGAATVCRLLPYVLLGPFGGAVADRYRRRTVLLAGDALRMLLMAALAATVATGGPVALVIAFTVLTSAAGCAERPAAMALLPRLVGETRLGPANALLHTVQDLGVLIGPAIGAILLGVAPAWIAFAANGATFAVSALLISTMRPDPAPAGGRVSGVGQLAGGLRTCTRSGPRVIEVNARMGGARIHQMVEAVWGVDLIEAQLRSCLDLPQTLMPSRKPRCAVVNAIVYAPATGRLADLPFTQVALEADLGVELDILAETGQEVTGPDHTFATALAELTLSGKNMRHARRRAAQVLRDPPRVLPA